MSRASLYELRVHNKCYFTYCIQSIMNNITCYKSVGSLVTDWLMISLLYYIVNTRLAIAL